jgi:hypothetical protein
MGNALYGSRPSWNPFGARAILPPVDLFERALAARVRGWADGNETAPTIIIRGAIILVGSEKGGEANGIELKKEFPKRPRSPGVEALYLNTEHDGIRGFQMSMSIIP